jgi:hypothetical protein
VMEIGSAMNGKRPNPKFSSPCSFQFRPHKTASVTLAQSFRS